MKRRQFIQHTGAGLLGAMGIGLASQWQAAQAQSSGSVVIQWLGHTCFYFTGDGRRILVNPFRPIGCTAGYRIPRAEADLVLISSRLLDEGDLTNVPGNPRLLDEGRDYRFGDFLIQGTAVPHDREGGRRFGENIIWKWTQGGLDIVHMGGAAAPIGINEQILIGRPDVMLVPVGNGPKAYTPEDAVAAVQSLNPRLVIPTHYRTTAADEETCDLVPVDEFLNLMQGSQVSRGNGARLTLSRANLPDSGIKVQLFGDQSLLATRG
ncbi:MAG: MBL fold metallo-hydrolase [Cyanobacteria bacterium P01_A01_bin.123]